VPDQPILLKVLLRERHWQHYATFCAEYDKAALRVDPDLAQTYPSRAQLHRWLTGSLRGLPYPDHCRVLEEMFSGWTAEQLFQPATPDLLYTRNQPSSYGTTPPSGAIGPPVFAAPSVGLRPFVEQAFTREHVTIDFAGFSGETLHGVVQEPLDSIRIGRIKPASVTIRMLLPDSTKPMALPCRADDLADDPDYRDRVTRLTTRHAHAIVDTVQELTRLGLLESGSAVIRAHPCAPLFKVYILNAEEVFFGFYPIIKHRIPLPGGDRDIYDLMGKDAVVFHHSAHSGQPTDVPYIEQTRTWFESMWDTISYEYPA
jgi:hypothetical protein